jgi:phosphoinositide-3-kinase regulatory subunit 4
VQIWVFCITPTLGYGKVLPNLFPKTKLTFLTSGATAFIASAAKHLPASDVWGILYPSLRHFLRCDVRDVDEFSLLTALKPPVRRFVAHVSHANNDPQLERQIFDAALQWAMKADKTHFWRGHRKFTKLESPQDSVGAIRKASTTTSQDR